METKSELTALPASQVSLPVDEPNERNLAGEMGDQRGPARREPCDGGMKGHRMVLKKKRTMQAIWFWSLPAKTAEPRGRPRTSPVART